MKNRLTRLASVAMLGAALSGPLTAQAGFYGDNVTLTYSLANMPGASFSATSATVGAGVEFTGTATDGFGQIWSFAIDIADDSIIYSWTESTRAGEPNGGNISGGTNYWNFSLLFASTPVPPMALSAFSSSGLYSPGTPSMTGLFTTGPNELYAGFSRLDSTDSYTVTAIPEPGAWALLLAGLGLLGCRARRRAV